MPNRNHSSMCVGAPAKDHARRESSTNGIRPFVLIFLLLFLPVALFLGGTRYLYYYTFPKGTKVVPGDFSSFSRLAEAIYYNSSLPAKLKDLPLEYRYYTIPDGAEEIGDFAFHDRNSLREVRIPRSMRKIGNGAFSECTALRKIVIPEGVQTIGDGAFQNCTSPNHIELPKSLRTIGSYAFSGCKGLEEIAIPDGVTELGENAFEECSSLKHVTLPDTLESIENGAFSGCSALDQETVERLNAMNPNAFSSDLFLEE